MKTLRKTPSAQALSLFMPFIVALVMLSLIVTQARATIGSREQEPSTGMYGVLPAWWQPLPTHGNANMQLTSQTRAHVFDAPFHALRTQITTTAATTASLWLSISNGKTSVWAGEKLTYTLEYSNTGSGDAYSTTVVVTLPSGLLGTDVTCWPPSACESSGGQVIFDIGTVAVGEGSTVGLLAHLLDPLPAGSCTLAVTALISTATPADFPAGSRVEDVDAVATRQDLLVAVEYDALMPYPGKPVTYIVDYANYGHMAAAGVVVTATKPRHSTFEQDGSDACWVSQGDGRYRCPTGDLGYNEYGYLLFAVTLTTTDFTPVITNFDATFEIGDNEICGEDANLRDNFSFAPIGLPRVNYHHQRWWLVMLHLEGAILPA